MSVDWTEVLRASASFLLIYLVDYLISNFLMGYPSSTSAGSNFSTSSVTLHHAGTKHGTVSLTAAPHSTSTFLVSKLTERGIRLETPLDKSNVWIGEMRDRSNASSKTLSIRVAVKIVRGGSDVANLRKEYALYTGRLAQLQGKAVPRCYGFYEANGLAVLILEYIRTTPYTELGKDEAEEAHRLMMLGLCSIHEAGLTHGALFSNNRKRPHVLIQCGTNGRPTGIRFISFTKSTDNHRCTSGTPLVLEKHRQKDQCLELMTMESSYDATSREKTVKVRGEGLGLFSSIRLTLRR